MGFKTIRHGILMLALGVCPVMLLAAELIDTVKVFPDRATVTRQIEVTVEAGAGEFVQTDLPTVLMPDSIRITAYGPEGFRLGGYALAPRRGSEHVDLRAQQLSERIEALEDQRGLIDAAVQSRDLQLTLLRSLTASGVGAGDAGMNPQVWREALDIIGEGTAAVLEGKHALTLERRRVDREVQRLKRELADLGQQQRDSVELRMAYDSPAAGSVRFEIEYTVGAAAWRPVYEWWLDTEQGRLTIVQFAEVRQSTGEDWDAVQLVLSLAQPATGGRLPELSPWWVNVLPPAPAARTRMSAMDAAPAPIMAEALPSSPEGMAAGWAGAELSGTPYTQHYRVAGRQQVASDNQLRRFHLTDYRLEAEISARTVPRRQATAWLYAEAEYTGEAALPPGAVTLYQDRSLIGHTQFTGAVAGATLASSFGTDERIEIDYQLTADRRATEGMIRKSIRLTREFTIRIVNRHERPIQITVLEQMPVSRDERIQVELSRNTTPLDQRDVDDRPGILAWHRELPPRGDIQLVIGYQLVHPEEVQISGW